MTTLVIRQFKNGDLDAVLYLHKVALEATGTYTGSGKWDSDLLNIENTYLKNGGEFVVGIINERIVAMGAFRKVTRKIAEIKRMRVLPQFQHQGFGQAILCELEERAVIMGYNIFCLDTTIFQIAAQKLYLKNGYVEVRRTMEGFPFETLFYEKRV